ncbi:MAG: primosomal protein N' [Ruminococcaceae bacterium]|nr:primosomal protein N' [Oscillospiraceae bacterium]
MPQYASVYILDVPYAVDRAFDYYIPGGFRESIRVGAFVTVPFGGGNRRMLALVTALSDSSSFDERSLKPIASVCSPELYLDEKMLGLAFYMREQTLCTMGEAVHSMIPSAAFSKLTVYYKASDKVGDLRTKDEWQIAVLAHIRKKGTVSESALKNAFGASAAPAIEKLCAGGWIVRETAVKGASSAPSKSSFMLSVDGAEAKKIVLREKGALMRISSKGQLDVLSMLLSEGGYVDEDRLFEIGVTRANLRALLEKGLISEKKTEIYRDPYAEQGDRAAEKKEILLSDEQNAAFSILSELSESGEAKAALLHGVTGSGKTSVMMALIDKVLSDGRDVILLLPEISLTPQTISIFKGRYGDLCTVVHSALSAGERYDAYRRIASGEVRVAVGTRSAVFSPVKNLGLVIIDEEQEQTYKSDQNPKYHARDIARYRCAREKALMLLASATPSLESYLKAKEGKYKLIKLKNRYGGAKLPSVKIADMREEAQSGNISPIGSLLTKELSRVKKDGEQSILFLNRRGYNTFVSCRSCGEALSCPNCSVSMTYHTKKGSYSEGYLACHWCGHKEALPKTCPKCGSDKLAHMGYGTQRVEQELGILLPDARVLRMDTDTTSSKFSYDKLLGAFREREADILLGTQMVTKGHDFPGVTLVGVLLADSSLYLDDYRANERTFALITQVIGRAGRASDKGRAVIQTGNPDHDVIKLACAQDYETFFEREIKLRKLLVFPPFCDIVLLTVSSEDERELLIAVRKLCDEFSKMTKGDGEFSDVQMIVFGPFEAPVYRVEGRCRMRLVIKCRLNKRSRELFAATLRMFSGERAMGRGGNVKKPYLTIDFNPSSL